ncbi:hypothetical protein Aperf_G00000081934 [Anoplocephala perfoliata]
MSPAVEWQEQPAFYRFRAWCSVFVFPFAFVLGYSNIFIYFSLFVYPLMQMTVGYPIEGNYKSYCFIIIFFYTLYWISDVDSPYRGGHRRNWFRSLFLWKWISQYFQARLVISEELMEWIKENNQETGESGGSVRLPLSFNYLLGYHPHGFLPIGAALAYGCESLNFSKFFPGIKSYVTTLNLMFRVPILRDWALSLGAVSVSKESLEYLLSKNAKGNLVAVSVGGAREVVESRPGRYVFVLSRRRGFFRIAMKTGACLMPSIVFGETNLYEQVANPKGSRIRKLQDWWLELCSMAPPFFYSPLFIPYRRPLNIVVGRPIMCKMNANPTDDEVYKLRDEYKQQLVQMFNKYRPIYDPTAEDIQFI